MDSDASAATDQPTTVAVAEGSGEPSSSAKSAAPPPQPDLLGGAGSGVSPTHASKRPSRAKAKAAAEDKAAEGDPQEQRDAPPSVLEMVDAAYRERIRHAIAHGSMDPAHHVPEAMLAVAAKILAESIEAHVTAVLPSIPHQAIVRFYTASMENYVPTKRTRSARRSKATSTTAAPRTANSTKG